MDDLKSSADDMRENSAVMTEVAVACSPSAEFFEKWTSCARTRSGEQICIRPLRADDRERESVFINSLSEHSRYFRLFTPLRFLSRHLIDQLMDIRSGSTPVQHLARHLRNDGPLSRDSTIARSHRQCCLVAHEVRSIAKMTREYPSTPRSEAAFIIPLSSQAIGEGVRHSEFSCPNTCRKRYRWQRQLHA